MADKKAEAETPEVPKKKGKLMLFVIIGVVVLVIAAGAAAFLLMKKAPAEGEEGEEDAPAKTEKKKKDKKKDAQAMPAFYKFDKPFTVKLQSDGGEAYLQVDVQAKLLDATLIDRMKGFDPEIKHKVTLLLLGKKASELNSAQGVQKLSNEIRETINNILEPPNPRAKKASSEPSDEADPDAPVQAILFTTFIVQ